MSVIGLMVAMATVAIVFTGSKKMLPVPAKQLTRDEMALVGLFLVLVRIFLAAIMMWALWAGYLLLGSHNKLPDAFSIIGLLLASAAFLAAWTLFMGNRRNLAMCAYGFVTGAMIHLWANTSQAAEPNAVLGKVSGLMLLPVIIALIGYTGCAIKAKRLARRQAKTTGPIARIAACDPEDLDHQLTHLLEEEKRKENGSQD